MSLSQNFNICIVSFISVYYLFLWRLRFLWFIVCQVISEYILDIFNIVVWDYESSLNPLRSVDIFVLVGNHLARFRAHVLTIHLCVCFQCQFSLQSFYDATQMCPYMYLTQWLVWDGGSGLSHILVFKVYSMLFRVRSMHVNVVGKLRIHKVQFPPSPQSSQYFLAP